ncbi:MAG: hypothetical protein ACFFFH_10635 [Candidatus Thorarchaeota archaeon]
MKKTWKEFNLRERRFQLITGLILSFIVMMTELYWGIVGESDLLFSITSAFIGSLVCFATFMLGVNLFLRNETINSTLES